MKACAALLLDLVEGALSLAIFDQGGELIWAQSGATQQTVETHAADWCPEDDKDWHVSEYDVRVRSQAGRYQIYSRRIPCEEEGDVFYLYLRQAINAGTTRIADRQAAHRAVICLSQLLGTHYSLNNELNSMTDELARRYEELNLLYNTDEHTRSLSEKETVLNEIVENCIDYLNVDIAALCLTESAAIVATQADRESEAVLDVEALRESVLQLVAVKATSLVLNTQKERDACGLDINSDHKIVASPICDRQGRLLGTLLIANGPGRRDFENGDRNLLNATADKVSKIVSADYDGLTGLAAREGFEHAVSEVLNDAVRRGRDVCVLHANIDQLQLVNDTFGHEVGDDLIRQVANVMPQILRGNDCVSRLSGDEFGMLLLDCNLDNAIRMADRVCERVSQVRCNAGDRELDVGISIGIAKIGDDIDSVISAMATADLACSIAKEQGRGRAFAYRSEDEELQARKHQMQWVGKIQSALRNNEFVLYSQVIEPTDRVKGKAHFEILLRMVGKNEKILSPAVFMPVAERYHLMPSIDRWVIEHSLATLEQWEDSGRVGSSVFTINLSGQSLMDEKTLDFLLAKLRKTRAPVKNICFEITENAAITDLYNAQRFISSVKSFGCQFALDDFGAGVSSFANLRDLDVDYLKIDGSFVVDMATDAVSASMVAAINQVGQTMELKTVAEFVETAEIRAILTDLGVDYLQGFDIGKPKPLVDQLHELAQVDVRSA